MIKSILKFFLNLPLPFFLPYKIFWKLFYKKSDSYLFKKTKKKQKNQKKKILFALKNLGLGDCILIRPSILYFMKTVDADFYFYHENKIGKDWLDFFFKDKIKSITKWQEVKSMIFFQIFDLTLNEAPFVLKLRRIPCQSLIGIGFGYKKFIYDIFRKPIKKQIRKEVKNSTINLKIKPISFKTKSSFQKYHAADYWTYLITGEKNKKNKINNLFYLLQKKQTQKTVIEKTTIEKKSIVMVPFAGVKKGRVVSSEKCWHVENYLKLAEKIYKQLNIKTTFIGIPDERNLFEESIKKNKINPLAINNQIGKLDLKQVYNLLQQTKLVICNNSGIYHFSVAMKVPTVSFVNGVDINMWKNFVDDDIHRLFFFEEKEKIERFIF